MNVAHVLVVCTGNLCRSPMAEYWLRQQVPGLSVSSAGLHALVGQHIDPTTLRVLHSHGLEASAHRARQLAIWMVQNASLVLTAELRHKQHIERLYPHSRGRVVRMDEHLQQDIADPHRKSQAEHEHSFEHIRQALQPWVHKIHTLGYTPLAA